jgi:hypothetical protein
VLSYVANTCILMVLWHDHTYTVRWVSRANREFVCALETKRRTVPSMRWNLERWFMPQIPGLGKDKLSLQISALWNVDLVLAINCQLPYSEQTLINVRKALTLITAMYNMYVILVSKIPSFPSALQPRVSFGLLNNLPPFFSIGVCLVSEQFNFYGVGLSASRPTPNLEDQGIPLRLAPTHWLVQHGWPYQ